MKAHWVGGMMEVQFLFVHFFVLRARSGALLKVNPPRSPGWLN